jgi:ssDNA thymidine ADP-ribosyltransferase, DarT
MTPPQSVRLYPDPTLVFHITAIDNLKSTADKGAIVSKNCIAEAGLTASDIAYEEVQGLRAAKLIQEGRKGNLSNQVGSGGTLHDYVPFYFAPRSPMLFAINNGNVPGCDFAITRAEPSAPGARAGLGRGARTARTTRTCFANARHRPTVSKGAAVKSERPSQLKMDLWAQPAPRCRRRQTRLRQSPTPQCPQRRA